MFRFLARIDKSYWIFVFPLLGNSIPFIANRMRAIVPFCISLLWFVLVRRRRPVVDFVLDKWFWLMLLFYLLQNFLPYIYAVFGHGDFVPYYKMATTFSSGIYLVIVYWTIKMKKFDELKFLTIIVIIGIVLSGINSFRASGIEGFEGGRALTTNLDKHFSMDAAYNKMDALEYGVVGYGGTYAIAWYLGVWILALKHIYSKKVRTLVCLAIAGSLIVLRTSGLGTPIFVGIMSVAFGCWAWTTKGTYRLFWAGVMLGFGLLFFSAWPQMFSFLSGPLQSFAQLFPENSSIWNRIHSVSEAVRGDFDTYAVNRYQLQLASLKTFCEFPLFGVGAYNFPHEIFFSQAVGGHSEICDLMAMRGLVGFLVYILYIRSIFGYMNRISKICGTPYPHQMAGIFLAGYIFSSIANPQSPLPSGFYIIMPGLSLFFKGSPFAYQRKIR